MTDEGTGHGVYLRGATWWIRYCGPRPNGTWGEIRESAGEGATRKRAEKLRTERLHGVSNHKRGIRKFQGPQQEKVTVGELLDNLERDYVTRKIKSLRGAKNHMKPVRAFFGFDRAVRVTTPRIEDYIAHRRDEEKADATIDRELEMLAAAFKVAKDSEPPLVAWAPKVPRLVKPGANARQGYVERGQLDRLLPELPSQLLRDVALFAYGTGMRKGEVLALTWAGYDREGKVLRLHASVAKTGRGRAVALGGWPEIAAVIERRLQERRLDCPLIFHNGRGGKVGDFYTTWERALDRAKLPHFTIHDFRRTALRNNIRAGVARDVAMAISGHLTDSTFRRYNITDERDLAEAMVKRAAYEAALPKAEEDGKGVASIAEAGSHTARTFER